MKLVGHGLDVSAVSVDDVELSEVYLSFYGTSSTIEYFALNSTKKARFRSQNLYIVAAIHWTHTITF